MNLYTTYTEVGRYVEIKILSNLGRLHILKHLVYDEGMNAGAQDDSESQLE